MKSRTKYPICNPMTIPFSIHIIIKNNGNELPSEPGTIKVYGLSISGILVPLQILARVLNGWCKDTRAQLANTLDAEDLYQLRGEFVNFTVALYGCLSVNSVLHYVVDFVPIVNEESIVLYLLEHLVMH